MGSQNNGGASSIDTSNMLKGATGTNSVGAKKAKYELFVDNGVMKSAVETDFQAYVTPESQAYVKEHLGYIDPRLIIQLSSNLGRLLEKPEVELLGGVDTDQEALCELTVDQLVNEEGVEGFDDLPKAMQARCMFRPHWGLAFTGNNVVVHLLNVMLSPDKPHQNDLAQALLFVAVNDIIVRGNKMKVYTEDGGVNEATVSGKFFHITKEGAVYRCDRNGHLGRLEKEFIEDMQICEMPPHTRESHYELTTFEVTVDSLLASLRNQQETVKAETRQRKVGVTKAFASRLLGKRNG